MNFLFKKPSGAMLVGVRVIASFQNGFNASSSPPGRFTAPRREARTEAGGGQLSGGQKQRIALARALLKERFAESSEQKKHEPAGCAREGCQGPCVQSLQSECFGGERSE